jgi:diguanylate cyclase (GGDEF)-like protein/PAS domain S-box-containing protein
MGTPDTDGGAVPQAARDALARLAAGGWPEELSDVLGEVGEAAGVDRVYLFQNVRGDDGRLWMDMRGSWTATGVSGLFEDPSTRLHPYYPDFAGMLEILSAGGALRSHVRDLVGTERAVLETEGTRSVLVLPVTVGAEWWGFAGFDACGQERAWTEGDVATLRALVVAVTSAVVRERADQDRLLQEDRFRAIVEQGPAISYIDACDERAASIYIGPQVEGVLGYTPQEWYADPDLWPRVLHPDDRARALAENERHNETGDPFSLEYRMFTRDGRVVWIHDEARMVHDERGAPRYSYGVMVDITQRMRTEEQVAFQTYHDPLTGLPSQVMFEELLELSLARARRHDASVAVLCVDLDDFRLVNDSLGHGSGDVLLQMVADRLREATRETDLVARHGGDRFSLLLADLEHDVEGPDEAVVRAQSVAQRAIEAFAAPFAVAGTEVYVSASVGISLFPQDAQEPGDLQRSAEAAMYEAKKNGTTSYVLSSGGSVDSAAKLRFVTRLRKAVDAQRWTLHYQPVVELDSGRMVGVEALIRWIEPDGTMVPPLEFIPLAEDLGLIEQIGDWVVREISYQAQAWRELDMDLEVGFNLSPRQFWQPDLAERITREIRRGGIDPARVLVEVTESSAMMDPDRAQNVLMELHAAGFSIAIDDFGTGYSSLSRLRTMPVRVLKIDRSFIQHVHEDPQSASIVSAFLALAGGLDMTTLAEGIETAEQLAFLRDRGCELGQGFYFSKPVPPEEIIAYAFGGIPNAPSLRTA